MSVLIQINGENAGEALKELSTLASGITGQAVLAAPAAAAEAPKQTRTRKTETAKETPAAAQSEEKPVDVDQLEKELDEEASSDEPIPTDVELRAAATEARSKGASQDAIKALLGKYGVPNITAVPEGKRIAFKRELEGLARAGGLG